VRGVLGQAELKLKVSPAIALAAAEQAIGLLAADVALADEPYASWVDPARGQLPRPARTTFAWPWARFSSAPTTCPARHSPGQLHQSLLA